MTGRQMEMVLDYIHKVARIHGSGPGPGKVGLGCPGGPIDARRQNIPGPPAPPL